MAKTEKGLGNGVLVFLMQRTLLYYSLRAVYAKCKQSVRSIDNCMFKIWHWTW